MIKLKLWICRPDKKNVWSTWYWSKLLSDPMVIFTALNVKAVLMLFSHYIVFHCELMLSYCVWVNMFCVLVSVQGTQQWVEQCVYNDYWFCLWCCAMYQAAATGDSWQGLWICEWIIGQWKSTIIRIYSMNNTVSSWLLYLIGMGRWSSGCRIEWVGPMHVKSMTKGHNE